MNGRTSRYVERANIYLTQASDELARGDTLQASEKGWGAAAQMVKAVATERGWRHGRHNYLFDAVDRIALETSDPDFNVLFSLASDLHSNYYDGFLSHGQVTANLDRVTLFTEKMRALLNGG